MKIFIAFLFLIFPTWFEGYRDRNGDAHPNNDWKLRGIICLISGIVATIILPKSEWMILDFLRYSTSSILLFTSVFPYWINFIHLKNGVTRYNGIPKTHIYNFKNLNSNEVLDHVVKHLSDTAWPDKEKWYRAFGWGGRLIAYLLILCVAILLLFV